ncbi:MAG: class B sortase [Butyrivibrio sp.]|nr:class B sortase [Butyrivibrio sp.]
MSEDSKREFDEDKSIDESKNESGSNSSNSRNVWRIIRIALIIILIGVIGYESIGLYNDNKEYKEAENEYEEIEDSYVVFNTAKEEEQSLEYPDLQINHSSLKLINDAYIGWLYFPALDISYPVVKEEKVNQFLRVTFDGVPNTAGSIFMDVMSDENFRGMSDFVFGHNMRNGSMFGKLKKLYQSDEDLLKDNKYVYVYTEEFIFKYEIFAYYKTRVGSDSYALVTSEDEYDEFLDYIDAVNVYKESNDIDFSTYPSLLTLSTCAGQSGSGNRFVVHTAKVAAWKIG